MIRIAEDGSNKVHVAMIQASCIIYSTSIISYSAWTNYYFPTLRCYYVYVLHQLPFHGLLYHVMTLSSPGSTV